jgi:hypothetical protein
MFAAPYPSYSFLGNCLFKMFRRRLTKYDPPPPSLDLFLRMLRDSYLRFFIMDKTLLEMEWVSYVKSIITTC